MRRPPLFWMSLASLVLAAGLYGCETPESFHISGDGSLLASGTGGDDGTVPGTGGGLGTGGIRAFGGSSGSGGISLSTGGTGVLATGGAGGRTGSGGVGAGGKGGNSSGTGGHATGGAVATGGTPTGGNVGSGGRAMGGSVGSGGISPGTGGSGNGGRPATGGSGMGGGAAGGAVGTGPCAGLCTPATDFKFTSGTTYQSGNLGTTAACYEVATTLTIQGGGCSNCTIATPARTVKINGMTAANNGSWSGVPAKVNGGYCIQITAGSPDYTQFYTF